MVQIQVDLSDEENKIVSIQKVLGGQLTKEETVKFIIRDYARLRKKSFDEVLKNEKRLRKDKKGSTDNVR